MNKYFKTILLVLFLVFYSYFTSAQNGVDSIPKEKEKRSLVVNLFSKYVDNLNYFTITALMTVESSFIPFPSEIVVPPAAYQACNPENSSLYVTDSRWFNIAFVIFFATLGAMFGAIINYFLALFLGRPFIYWFVETKLGKLCLLDTKKVQKAEDYFVKNGNISTFIGRFIPAIRQLISIPAGLAKMKMRPFLLYTFLGAALWNMVLALLGYFAHGQQEMINRYNSEISYIILGLVVLFGIYLLWKVFGKKQKE
jgi:membrane protein DedA with SNARE-associated domain